MLCLHLEYSHLPLVQRRKVKAWAQLESLLLRTLVQAKLERLQRRVCRRRTWVVLTLRRLPRLSKRLLLLLRRAMEQSQ